MARFNSATLMGKVLNMNAKPVGKNKTDGENGSFVLNFQMECHDEVDKRNYRIPVAVWGDKEVEQCLDYLNEGDLALVQGEIRYKFIRVNVVDEKTGEVVINPRTNKPLKKLTRIYTAVKANTVEFLSKKLKGESLQNYSINEIKLIGNLCEDAKIGDEGFVVAVDRLYPTKEAKAPNHQLTDYVTLIVKDENIMKGNLKKGSVVIIDGKLMTRKQQSDVVTPTIVVDVKQIVGR